MRDPLVRSLLESLREQRKELLEQHRDASTAELRERMRAMVDESVTRHQRYAAATNNGQLLEDEEAARQELIDELLGLGLLERLMRQDGVQTIRVVSPTHVRVVRNGHQERVVGVRFDSEQQVRDIVKRVAAAAGRTYDESHPRVDVSLEDGSRLHAVGPPVTRQFTQITIRRFTLFNDRLPSLVRAGTLPQALADLLVAGVRSRLNIVLAGDSGIGKTTLQRMLLLTIDDPDEWLITMESTFELGLDLLTGSCQSWQERLPNTEKAGGITLPQLLEEDALRCEGSRVIVGECRKGEAFTLLLALNAGHRGTVTTIHARSAEDALDRLLTAAQLADRTPSERVLRRMIASNIDLVVFMEKRDGRRLVTEVLEVDHRLGENDTFGTRRLWQWQGGQLVRTDEPAHVIEDIRRAGVAYTEEPAA